MSAAGQVLAGASLNWGFVAPYSFAHWGRDGILNFTGTSNPYQTGTGSSWGHQINSFIQHSNPSEYALWVRYSEVRLTWTNGETFVVHVPNSGSNSEPSWNLDTNSVQWFIYQVSNGVTNYSDTVFMPESIQPESRLYEWSFEEWWSGSVVEFRDAQGNTVDLFIVPEGGGVVIGEVTAPSSKFIGMQVYIDGVPAATIFGSGFPNPEDWNDEVYRPGFNITWAGTSTSGGGGGTPWQARRSDGSVAYETNSPTVSGSSQVGRITMAAGDTATIWTRTGTGDGTNSTFVPTPIQISGNNNDVTYYTITQPLNPEEAPVPVTPTASPAPSPLPAPSPVRTTNNNTVIATPTPANDVTVDVEQLPVVESGDGEEGVLESVVAMHEKIRGILNDFEAMFANVALTYREFNQVAFGGVGQACTLAFGNVTINLSNVVPGFVRSGLKLVILLTVLFGAIRMTWDTFTSY